MKSDLASHAKPLGMILIISFIGILTSAAYQLVAIRALGAQDFAVLAAYVAVINIVAIGSAALRNSVAVGAAGVDDLADFSAPRRKLDGSSLEATVLSVLSIVLMLVALPPLNSSTGPNVWPLLLSALIIVPSFFFARAQGFIQGRGNPSAVVFWTTGLQILQLLLLLLLLLVQGLSVNSVLAVMAVTVFIGAVGAGTQVRLSKFVRRNSAFTAESVTVLLLTVAFAWLTNIDVLYVSGSGSHSAGLYAANAVLVKTTFIIPSALMLYMLPRFVRLKTQGDLARREMKVTLILTLVTAVIVFILFLSLGGWIIQVLFGADYTAGAVLLPWMSLMWLPWVLVQTALIPLTASASKVSVLVLVVAAALQWVSSSAALPNLYMFMILNGVIGAVVFAMLLILLRVDRQ